jgi:predicted hotdog family 3-hydroxylacyl-ACP dehydratase
MSKAPTMQEVHGLVPHHGEMCLLERIIEWDEEHIRLCTSSHRNAANPLKQSGRLRAVHLCEYGAQAMAVHGALKARAHEAIAEPGMLVSLRAVTFNRDYIEDLTQELIVEARCLQATPASLQYQFSVTHAAEVIAAGRAAVVLGKGGND